MTKKQKKREETAKMIEDYVGENETSRKLRKINRNIESKKGKNVDQVKKQQTAAKSKWMS